MFGLVQYFKVILSSRLSLACKRYFSLVAILGLLIDNNANKNNGLNKKTLNAKIDEKQKPSEKTQKDIILAR